jgi:hypothetical protein
LIQVYQSLDDQDFSISFVKASFALDFQDDLNLFSPGFGASTHQTIMAEVQSSVHNGSSGKDAASETVAAIAEAQVISPGSTLTLGDSIIV